MTEVDAHPRTYRQRAVDRHLLRMGEQIVPAPDATPELAVAYHSLNLHWLRTCPGYRELIRKRVNAERVRRVAHAERIERTRQRLNLDPPSDVDLLGPGFDPCG